jgi:hypothetical protein
MNTNKTYNVEILPSYIFYDSSFSHLISKINIHVPEDAIGEFRDDKEIIDYLYKSELSSVFNEENMEHIEFEKYNTLTTLFNHNEIKKCIQSIKDKNILPTNILPVVTNDEGVDISIIPLFFSYHLFFFTHLCIQDIISRGDITENIIDVIKAAIGSLL